MSETSATGTKLNFDTFIANVKMACNSPNAEESFQELAFKLYQTYDIADFKALTNSFKEKKTDNLSLEEQKVYIAAFQFHSSIAQSMITMEMDDLKECLEEGDMEGFLSSVKKLSLEDPDKIHAFNSLIRFYLQSSDPSHLAAAKKLYDEMPNSPEKTALQPLFAPLPDEA